MLEKEAFMATAHGRDSEAMRRLKGSSSPGRKKEVHLPDPVMHSPNRSTTQVIGKKLKWQLNSVLNS